MPFFGLILFAISVIGLIDVITRPEGQTKHLPKMGWLMVVILLPLIGTGLWFAIGREYPEPDSRVRVRPLRNRPLSAPAADVAPSQFDRRTTEQQLDDLEREIEADRLRAEIARKRAERGEV